MSATSCPRCGETPTTRNRLITDSCGHLKCRRCFLEDEEGCLECRCSNQEQQQTATATGNLNKNQKKKDVKAAECINKATIKGIKTATGGAGVAVTSNSLLAHIQQVQSSNGLLKFHCTICKKSFNSRSQRYYHAACGNEAAKKYKCEKCEKSFSSRSHLNYHLESHTTQTYKCSQCNKTFTKQAVLKKHQKLHQTATSKCVECGKSFRCKLNLKAHLEQHKNILRFQCHVCDKKYALKSTLRQHMLKHLAKKHECNVCGKQFQRNSTLKLHLKRHEKTESFCCKTCFKQFSDIGTFTRHAKIHEDTLKYKCIHCNIISKRKDNMLRHVRNMHLGVEFQACVEVIKPMVNTKDLGNDASAFRSNTDEVENSIVEQEIVYLPKTVQNSSVIKCIGNVQPVKIPEMCQQAQTAPLDSTNNYAIDENSATLANVSHNCTHLEQPNNEKGKMDKKHVKKKYDPIEMYRKILISDDEELSNDDEEEEMQHVKNINNTHMLQQKETIENQLEEQEQQQQQQQQRNTQHNASNFSEMHWRKNFKYTYEYQDF